MANIMREENGGDLTYFLEYYLELLSRAVDERRLRMSKKEEENRVAEQEMAHTPLSAPIATTGRDPEPTVGEVREEEENPTAVGSPDSAPEWQELIGTDPPTLPREEQNKSNVERLQEYAEDPETHIGQGANLLLHVQGYQALTQEEKNRVKACLSIHLMLVSCDMKKEDDQSGLWLGTYSRRTYKKQYRF